MCTICTMYSVYSTGTDRMYKIVRYSGCCTPECKPDKHKTWRAKQFFELFENIVDECRIFLMNDTRMGYCIGQYVMGQCANKKNLKTCAGISGAKNTGSQEAKKQHL